MPLKYPGRSFFLGVAGPTHHHLSRLNAHSAELVPGPFVIPRALHPFRCLIEVALAQLWLDAQSLYKGLAFSF